MLHYLLINVSSFGIANKQCVMHSITGETVAFSFSTGSSKSLDTLHYQRMLTDVNVLCYFY